MAIEVASFRIEGISPLLMHSPKAMRSAASSNGASRGSASKQIDPPEIEARKALYSLPNGRLYIGSDAVRNACLTASRDFRDESRRGRASFFKRFSAAVFAAEPEYLLERPDGTPITDAEGEWEVDIRRVMVQRNGVLRARPSISPWAATIRFEVDTDIIPTSAMRVLVEILNAAGRYPGLYDYRPEQGGSFGRFGVAA